MHRSGGARRPAGDDALRARRAGAGVSVELGPPIAGPSALGGSPRRFVYLALTLAVTDFKLRFFGSALGYLWQLVRPLLLFGVLYLVFTQFVKIGGAVAFYPVVLLANIVLYTFFQEGTGAVGSVVDRESLVRKIQFPRMAIPVSVVLTAGFNLVLNLFVVLVLRARLRRARRAGRWLEAPLLVGAARRAGASGSRCSCRRSTSATATSSRSGRSCSRCCSTRRP